MTDRNAIVTEGHDPWERIKGTRPLSEPATISDGFFIWPDETKRRVVLALSNTQGQPLAVQADAALRAAIRSLADYRALKPMSSSSRLAAAPRVAPVLELRAWPCPRRSP